MRLALCAMLQVVMKKLRYSPEDFAKKGPRGIGETNDEKEEEANDIDLAAWLMDLA